MVTMRDNRPAFYGVMALLFATTTAATIVWCGSMSPMGDMRMPGGWTMSMAWMRMPGQTLTEAAASFLGMWVVMMAAMMLPPLVPTLSRYREAVGDLPHPLLRRGVTRLGWLTMVVGAGYFFVWTAIGMAVWSVGFALSAAEMKHSDLSRAVPIAVALIVLMVGAVQFTAWKARRLACCRKSPALSRVLPASPGSAWRHGLRIGLDCGSCCFGLMLILIVIGVMDLRLMAVVTVAITAERLAPAGERVAQAIGAVTVATGLILIARAAGLG
jgi:predicted metal-binding membrane protein